MARYGQAESEEVRQQLMAKDDLRNALGATPSPVATEEIINAIERLIDAKLAERHTC